MTSNQSSQFAKPTRFNRTQLCRGNWNGYWIRIDHASRFDRRKTQFKIQIFKKQLDAVKGSQTTDRRIANRSFDIQFRTLQTFIKPNSSNSEIIMITNLSSCSLCSASNTSNNSKIHLYKYVHQLQFKVKLFIFL